MAQIINTNIASLNSQRNLDTSQSALRTEVPSVFRLPKGGFHATSFSFCCSLSQFSMN